MPNRLQWWHDRLTHDYTLIGACIVAVLFAALIWFLWIAPDLARYFAGRFLADGAVIGPVGPRAAGHTVGPVTQGGGPETYMPSTEEIRENAGNSFDYYSVIQEVGSEYTLSPKRIRENLGSPSVYCYNPVTQEK